MSFCFFYYIGKIRTASLMMYRDCDSPEALIDLTFDWLKKEWVDEIDFVVWTGDSAR